MSRSPQRLPGYLDFVRSQPCWFCFKADAVQAHHHGRTGGGMGIKGCDLHTIPLCHEHHREWHSKARVGGFTTEGTKTEMWRGIAATLRLYVIQLQGNQE